jgi:short-subunit dehydrogenase
MAYRSALITGASSGIGEALALALPESTDLLLHGRDETRLAHLAERLARPGRRVETVAIDLAEPGAAAALGERGLNFGIDLLVNNAGLGRYGPFAENPLADECEMVMANVLAPVVLTRMLLPQILERARANGSRGGVIIVASVVAFGPIPFYSTYAATKSFDLRLAQGLAAELAAEPVDILALCPGATATRFGPRSQFGPTGGHDAEQVAREGLAALGRRNVHVVGGINRAISLIFKLLPGDVTAPLAAAVNRRRRR